MIHLKKNKHRLDFYATDILALSFIIAGILTGYFVLGLFGLIISTGGVIITLVAKHGGK